MQLDLDLVHPDPDNIRDSAHDADVAELAADIARNGLLQPLVVYPAAPDDGVSDGHYLISAGHRRFFAVLSLGWTTAPGNVIDHPTDDLHRLDLMASENLQRRQLNPLEEAKLYRRYLAAGQTQAEVAARLHCAPSHVSNMMLLLELSADVQRRLASGEITQLAARKIALKARAAAGNVRRDYGGSHTVGYRVPYFSARHKLYGSAADRCREAQHDPALRIGAACGECWERTIRLDASRSPITTNEPPPRVARRPIERFSDPRDILRRIKCTRCGIGALERPTEHRCSAVRGGKRVLFDRHEFPMEISNDTDTMAAAIR